VFQLVANRSLACMVHDGSAGAVSAGPRWPSVNPVTGRGRHGGCGGGSRFSRRRGSAGVFLALVGARVCSAHGFGQGRRGGGSVDGRGGGHWSRRDQRGELAGTGLSRTKKGRLSAGAEDDCHRGTLLAAGRVAVPGIPGRGRADPVQAGGDGGSTPRAGRAGRTACSRVPRGWHVGRHWPVTWRSVRVAGSGDWRHPLAHQDGVVSVQPQWLVEGGGSDQHSRFHPCFAAPAPGSSTTLIRLPGSHGSFLRWAVKCSSRGYLKGGTRGRAEQPGPGATRLGPCEQADVEGRTRVYPRIRRGQVTPPRLP